jgi:hypothetical protein
MVTCVRLEQSLNADEPNFLTMAGIITFTRPERTPKA